MGALANLADTALAVAPGEVVTTTLQVRNAGSVVDEFSFEIIGADPEWTTVEPAILRLLPGDEGTVQVTMAPPRASDLPAGDVHFAIKVNSSEDPEGSVVEEGTLAISAFAEVTAELIPRSSQGSRVGKHEIAIDNRGNEFLGTSVTAFDADELLNFSITDPVMALEPGTAAFTNLEARPRKRFWRGANKTLPFQVAITDDDETREPLLLDGVMVQKALIPKWLPKALLALLALLLLLWILWVTLLSPTIDSRAQEAADEAAAAAVDEALEGPLAEQSEQIAGLDASVSELAADAAAQATPTATPTPTPTPTPTAPATPPPVESNLDASLTVAANAGGTDSDSLGVAADNTLQVTDIVLQNPDGNVGTLTVQRNSTVLLRVALANFRDLDYHFVSPIVISGGQSLVLGLSCDTVTTGDNCSAGALINGVLLTPEE